jgi:hypothetical protein
VIRFKTPLYLSKNEISETNELNSLALTIKKMVVMGSIDQTNFIINKLRVGLQNLMKMLSMDTPAPQQHNYRVPILSAYTSRVERLHQIFQNLLNTSNNSNDHNNSSGSSHPIDSNDSDTDSSTPICYMDRISLYPGTSFVSCDFFIKKSIINQDPIFGEFLFDLVAFQVPLCEPWNLAIGCVEF